MDKKEYRLTSTVYLSREEKKSISDIVDEYGFCLPATVLHLARETAAYFKKKKVTDYAVGLDRRNSKGRLIREALDLYAPFYITKNFVPIKFEHSVPVDPEEVGKELNNFGISNLPKYYRAIIRAIIKYPREASSIKVFGVYSKKGVGILDTKKLYNKKIKTVITLPMEDNDVLNSIASSSGCDILPLIGNVVKTLCDTEFYNGHTPENGEVFREIILSPPRVLDGNGQGKYGRIPVCLSDLKYSVQAIYIINKYHIPSLNDFIKRIAYFIIKSYRGEISLRRVRIIDNEDYNETRLIRKAYRRELYADNR